MQGCDPVLNRRLDVVVEKLLCPEVHDSFKRTNTQVLAQLSLS